MSEKIQYLSLEDIIERIEILDNDEAFYLQRLKTCLLHSDVRYYGLILSFIYEEKKLLKELARKKHNYII